MTLDDEIRQMLADGMSPADVVSVLADRGIAMTVREVRALARAVGDRVVALAPPPPTAPAPRPRAGSLEWYRWKLQRLEDHEDAIDPERNAQALAQMSRQCMQLADRIVELEQQEEAKNARRLATEERINRLRLQASSLPDALLEPFVQEFCDRHNYDLQSLRKHAPPVVS